MSLDNGYPKRICTFIEIDLVFPKIALNDSAFLASII